MRQSKRRKMASLDAMDVATRFVNAANQHDPDSLVACVHRDFQSIQPVHPDRNFRGVGQLRNNWEAIFRTEPGFRLTVLRATATEDTVWMELHGAGDDEEAAGTFILGVEEGRIRWVRVYSDIVQAPPDHLVEDPAAVLAEVPAPPQDEDEGEEQHEDQDDDWDAVVSDGASIVATTKAADEARADGDAVSDPGGGGPDAGDAGSEADSGERKSWRRLLRGKAKS
jgi:hypothetical protein